MKNIPKRIFLVVGDESVKDFNDLDTEFVLWSTDRTHESDIEYKAIKKLESEEIPEFYENIAPVQLVPEGDILKQADAAFAARSFRDKETFVEAFKTGFRVFEASFNHPL